MFQIFSSSVDEMRFIILKDFDGYIMGSMEYSRQRHPPPGSSNVLQPRQTNGLIDMLLRLS